METITVDEEILEVWRTLTLTQKHSVLQMIHSFKEDEVEWTTEEIEQYNKEIEEAELSVANGQFTTQEDLEKEAKEW